MRLSLLLSAFLLCVSSVTAAAPRIAIIIDDIGYQRNDLKMVELPYPLTYAVLPHTPYGKQAAEQAFMLQKDVMLHMPMEATNRNSLGPGALTQEMTKQQVQLTLQQALADIPYAIGINNHMGSLFTALEQPMAWTMEYLQQRQLFFIDSLTTPQSTARRYAKQYNVTILSRHVFLDNEQNQQALEKQFKQLLQIARRHETAIAIGHPYPETYRFLQQRLPQLQAEGIELVGISALLPESHQVIAAGFTEPASYSPEE
ncbi:divergent polysaccharide deacetylase family protein [Rheinheimera sp. UJ63]|uniref:divergent polysaccharide deacetylase family protein n=1 Tax=Rheinheimera sp. UJ63 TaxID=2910157 RepID=UPI001F2E2172|nr:divergent polysaccharide deacetylase family protein [Rheinheimera sp. UJ63]MCF4008411.1 divergent polysaccharide deacetylase family protein [Rheinheimera sp. UJ63]